MLLLLSLLALSLALARASLYLLTGAARCNHTHRQFGPTVALDGSCSCDMTPNQKKLVEMVHSHGLKVQASPNLDVTSVLPKAVGGKGHSAYRAAYLRTIGAAVAACDFDGLEFDYEPLNDCSAAHLKVRQSTSLRCTVRGRAP